jgi:hypothetical protein
MVNESTGRAGGKVAQLATSPTNRQLRSLDPSRHARDEKEKEKHPAGCDGVAAAFPFAFYGIALEFRLGQL